MGRDMSRLLYVGLPKGRFLTASAAVLTGLGADGAKARQCYTWQVQANRLNLCFKLLKTQDIPPLLASNVLQFGVTSDEWVAEWRAPLIELLDLRWCVTNIVVASAVDIDQRPRAAPAQAIGPRIATSYPNLTERYLREKHPNLRVRKVVGSAEAFVPDFCDAIVDCVETGGTLQANGLAIRTVLFTSSVRLFAAPAKEWREYADDMIELFRPHQVKEMQPVVVNQGRM